MDEDEKTIFHDEWIYESGERTTIDVYAGQNCFVVKEYGRRGGLKGIISIPADQKLYNALYAIEHQA